MARHRLIPITALGLAAVALAACQPRQQEAKAPAAAPETATAPGTAAEGTAVAGATPATPGAACPPVVAPPCTPAAPGPVQGAVAAASGAYERAASSARRYVYRGRDARPSEHRSTTRHAHAAERRTHARQSAESTRRYTHRHERRDYARATEEESWGAYDRSRPPPPRRLPPPPPAPPVEDRRHYARVYEDHRTEGYREERRHEGGYAYRDGAYAARPGYPRYYDVRPTPLPPPLPPRPTLPPVAAHPAPPPHLPPPPRPAPYPQERCAPCGPAGRAQGGYAQGGYVHGSSSYQSSYSQSESYSASGGSGYASARRQPVAGRDANGYLIWPGKTPGY